MYAFFFCLINHFTNTLTNPHFKYISASLQALYTIVFILSLYNGVPKIHFTIIN